MQVARDYGVLIEEDGVALRGLFIIDPKGILRQITINDLPVGRSVEETLRLVKAFQFTVRLSGSHRPLGTRVTDAVLCDPLGRAWRGVPRQLEGGLQDYEGGPQGLARVLQRGQRAQWYGRCEEARSCRLISPVLMTLFLFHDRCPQCCQKILCLSRPIVLVSTESA